jgi:hypothetical protein
MKKYYGLITVSIVMSKDNDTYNFEKILYNIYLMNKIIGKFIELEENSKPVSRKRKRED